jgi:glycosyltransferase involved in cell wall biosynthesis
MPTVSVIIPTFNRAIDLKNAIESVLNQTFQDFELIVVDDASTDATSDVVPSIHDDRIKYLRHETQKGGAAARNTGIINSTCDYIAFLDDDDEWFPEKLARQMALLLASPQHIGCVYTGYVTVDRGSGKKMGKMVPSKRGDLSKELLIGNRIGGTSSILIKRKCLDKVGLFDERLPSFQDYDLWIRISKSFHFEYIKDPLLNYYFHAVKIWMNLDAINEGLTIMREKYGSSRTFRKYLSYQHLSLGVSYCYSRKTPAAIGSYLRAIRLYPYELRHYLNLGLCLLGSGTFVKVKEKKAGFMGFLRLNTRSGDAREIL